MSVKHNSLTSIANFLFEAGMLQKTPRSGFHFLGIGKQSVAEHLNRCAYVGFALAHMNGTADVGKVVQMCLFHDFTEARISDLAYVHQKYTERHEEKAIVELTDSLPFGKSLKELFDEYFERTSIESLLAKDADNIELLLSIKEQVDVGNERAKTWYSSIVGRIKTEEGKVLVEKILETNSDDWWFSDKNDAWWIHRKEIQK